MSFSITFEKNAPLASSVGKKNQSSTSSGTDEEREHISINIENDPEDLCSEVGKLSTIVQKIMDRVKSIENRNHRVEQEKETETGYIRRFSITGLAYFGAMGYYYLLSVKDPYLHAVVPAGVYFLSTIGGFHRINACWNRRFHSKI